MKLIVANWKMNPLTEREALRLLTATQNAARKNPKVKVVICAPYVWIPALAEKIKTPLELGAQDCFWEQKGAYTGGVSAAMLKNLGCRWVILGHSERRKYLGENDEMVNKKIKAALAADLKVILCIGEPLTVRKKGLNAAQRFVKNQLRAALQGFENWKLKIENLVLVYEPVWAVSTSRSNRPQNLADTPANAAKMIQFVRNQLLATRNQPPVLYGGSVTDKNISTFVNQPGVDGVLVGSASVDAKVFPKLLSILS